ncbi:MAG: response regulator transcription factor, partial [Clostridia bacterium]|nr:response regulator transcription factor [Clostridia bacterium]
MKSRMGIKTHSAFFYKYNFFNDFSIFYGIMVVCGGVQMRILLVEDEKRMAQALCEILRLEKYEV